MAEKDVSAVVIRRTQETLGKYVKKPVLSEKLLKKPPFRFLHDVFIAIINNTGYFGGLYTAEELNYENIKNRDEKIQFLNKMIDVIKLMTNAPINIRASKIVAGHEAENTNELLFLIGKVIDEEQDWKPLVKKLYASSSELNKIKIPIVQEKSTNKFTDKYNLKSKEKSKNYNENVVDKKFKELGVISHNKKEKQKQNIDRIKSFKKINNKHKGEI